MDGIGTVMYPRIPIRERNLGFPFFFFSIPKPTKVFAFERARVSASADFAGAHIARIWKRLSGEILKMKSPPDAIRRFAKAVTLFITT